MDVFLKVATIVSGLVGLPALFALLIDTLKRFGVVTDGNSGKWSAGFNLLTLIVVAVLVQFVPTFDIGKVDNTLVEVAKFVGLILSYVFQIFVTNSTHKLVPLYSFAKG